MNMTQALIQSLRDLGISQSEIARKTGIPQPRISRWQNGDTPVGADDALRLADFARAQKIKKNKAIKPQEASHA